MGKRVRCEGLLGTLQLSIHRQILDLLTRLVRYRPGSSWRTKQASVHALSSIAHGPKLRPVHRIKTSLRVRSNIVTDVSIPRR